MLALKKCLLTLTASHLRQMDLDQPWKGMTDLIVVTLILIAILLIWNAASNKN